MRNIFMVAVSMISISAFANMSGTYSVVRGFAETMSVSQTEQLGKFRLVMKDASRGKLKIKGVIRGILNPATGTLITAEDYISNVFGGDPTCANGSVPFQVEETLNIVAGTGIFANVQPGSYVIVEGTVNNCYGLPNFLQNDFNVTSGSIVFN